MTTVKLLRLKHCILLLCSVLSTIGMAQQDSLAILFKIDCPNARSFTTDRLQNIYIVDNRNQVIKYNLRGKQQFIFNNNKLGELDQIDATDPFNILLFYPDYRTVFTLDRTLSNTGKFNLQDLDLIDVTAVGISSDNNLWVYDDINFTIKKIDRNGNTLITGSNLNLILKDNIYPNFIIERQQSVFINDPETGIIVLDIFGNFIKTIPIKGLTNFQIINNLLIYQKEQKIKTFHLKSLMYGELPFKIMDKDMIRIEKDRIYIKSDLSIKVYALP